jgi:hypothetical protein
MGAENEVMYLNENMSRHALFREVLKVIDLNIPSN